MKYKTIYFPMTADILHPGHLKSIRWLERRCDCLLIGLITDKGLKGYKKPIMPFKDRFFMLDGLWGKNINIIGQDSLNPEKNIKKYRPDSIASGDGWEKEELKVIKKYHLGVINIKNKSWMGYSSSALKKKIRERT